MKKENWFSYAETVNAKNPPKLCAEIMRIVLSKRYFEVNAEETENGMRVACNPTKKSFSEPRRNNFIPYMMVDLQETETGTKLDFRCEATNALRMIAIALFVIAILVAGVVLFKAITAGKLGFSVLFAVLMPVIIRIFIKSEVKATSKLLISEISRMLD